MKWKRNDIVIEEPISDYLSKIFDEEIEKGHMFKVHNFFIHQPKQKNQ